MCRFGKPSLHWNTPGKYTSHSGIFPLLAHTMNSACCLNPLRRGLQPPMVLSQTAIPRKVKPAAWMTSVRAGSCRQSMKHTTIPLGFKAWNAPDSQVWHQYIHDRWSMLSKSKSS
jgi:hypothetical protein